jgi:hypothetical protein
MKNFAVTTLGLLTVAGATLLFASVNTDHDKTVDFGKYHSYSWIGVKASDDIWASRIKDAVNLSLTQKGWTMTPSGGDASVSALGSTKNVQTLNTFYDGLVAAGAGDAVGEAELVKPPPQSKIRRLVP